jgi:hypothetical protein
MKVHEKGDRKISIELKERVVQEAVQEVPGQWAPK